MKNVIKEVIRPNGAWVLRFDSRLGFVVGFKKTGKKRVSESYQMSPCYFLRNEAPLAIEVFEKFITENEEVQS